jgi:hypothetical protein
VEQHATTKIAWQLTQFCSICSHQAAFVMQKGHVNKTGTRMYRKNAGRSGNATLLLPLTFCFPLRLISLCSESGRRTWTQSLIGVVCPAARILYVNVPEFQHRISTPSTFADAYGQFTASPLLRFLPQYSQWHTDQVPLHLIPTQLIPWLDLHATSLATWIHLSTHLAPPSPLHP